MKTYVLYHAHCADGFCAALAAWLKLGNKAEYIPMSYDDPLPDIEDESMVYLLDYSRPPEDLQALGERCGVTVLDHHESAVRRIEAFHTKVGHETTFGAHLDLSKSGAVLAWEWFHSEAPLPALFAYVQDRDLWRWKLPQSREVNARLASLDFDFKTWDVARTALDDPAMRDRFIAEGKAILDYQDRLVESMAKKVRVIPDPTHNKGPCRSWAVINGTCLRSELAHKVLEDHPEVDVAAVWWVEEDGTYRTSLRSRKGGPNVAQIAESFGGGGHPTAAGFSTEGPWWR